MSDFTNDVTSLRWWFFNDAMPPWWQVGFCELKGSVLNLFGVCDAKIGVIVVVCCYTAV